MESCSFCFQSIKIFESGKLSILAEDFNDDLSIAAEKTPEGHLSFTYTTKHQLKAILLRLKTKLKKAGSMAAIHNNQQRPSNFQFYPFHTLLAHVLNEETVKLIETGKFVSYVQPILLAQSRELYGYESLLRAEDQEISPYQLFQIAQETEMQSILDKKAREAAIKARVNQIPNGIKSFINFLPSTIYNPEFCLKHTFDIVKAYGVSPQDLVFEVVETEKIEDMKHLKNILETYRANGMKVALDDLGAGFATLEILQELHPDYVKIDRHYITNCHEDYEKQSFLFNVINLGRKLNIKVLGEGIEKEEEYEFLKESGIDLVQGYLFGKPTPSPLANRRQRILPL